MEKSGMCKLKTNLIPVAGTATFNCLTVNCVQQLNNLRSTILLILLYKY